MSFYQLVATRDPKCGRVLKFLIGSADRLRIGHIAQGPCVVDVMLDLLQVAAKMRMAISHRLTSTERVACLQADHYVLQRSDRLIQMGDDQLLVFHGALIDGGLWVLGTFNG